jgi:hypothetical protein
MDIVCPVGKSITHHITNGSGVSICTVTVHAQKGLGTITYHEMAGPPAHVSMVIDVTSLQTTTSGGILNCGIANGTHNDGSYVGTTTVTGTNTASEQIDVSIAN